MATRIGSDYAIGTASCKRSGYTAFRKNSAGHHCVSRRSKGIARSRTRRRR